MRISHLNLHVLRQFAVQFAHHRAQFLIHHHGKTDETEPVNRPKGCEIFVSTSQMRITSRVLRSQALCDFACFEVRLEIDETVHHDRKPLTLHTRTSNQPSHLSRKIFPKFPALYL